ncbi:MAG: DUF362 domain-containing protein [Thermoplasmatota archaeon]
MNNVYFFTDLAKLEEACCLCDFSDFAKKTVLVKLHMGERRNKYFPKPVFVKKVIDQLQRIDATPFLYDTTVCYKAPRYTVKGYRSLARLHGFTKRTMGCDICIDEDGVSVQTEQYNFEVGSLLHQAGHVFAISHVKGHNGTGMGGAIKNFGMGGVTKKTKKWMHTQAKPRYIQERCTYCGICADVCPFQAITVKNHSWSYQSHKCFGCDACVQNCKTKALEHSGASLQYLIACAAKASVHGKKVIYLNELKRISKNCDCDPSAGPLICPDIGYLVSTDPVAIDHASLELIHRKKPAVFKTQQHIDPYDQIRYGEEIGLGSSSYMLVEL